MTIQGKHNWKAKDGGFGWKSSVCTVCGIQRISRRENGRNVTDWQLPNGSTTRDDTTPPCPGKPYPTIRAGGIR